MMMRGNITRMVVLAATVVFCSVISVSVLYAQDTKHRLTGDDIVRGGKIGNPIPTENGKDGKDGGETPGPGCTIHLKSAPGILGPPCAFKCVGVSPENVSNYQGACNKSPPSSHGVSLVNEDGTHREDSLAPPSDGTPYCELFKGSADPWLPKVWFPNGHPRCGKVVGDPHLSTFDGTRYDLQSAGEFVVAKSLDDEFEVQARFEPWGTSQTVSLTTAVAVQVAPYRITVTLQIETPLRINGQAYDLPDGEYLILTKADAMIVRNGRRYSIVLPDQTNVHVDLINGVLINFFVLLSESRDGRMVGLSGDGDNDKANDFALRDGRQLSNPSLVKTLYKEYAESWRVSEDATLFNYDTGESWEDFQNPDMPYEYIGMEDIPSADRERAASACRAAGVRPGPALDDCIYDYALTGDVVFIESALSTQSPREFSSIEDTAFIDTPQAAIAGQDISVAFTGPVPDAGDRVTVARPEDLPNTFSDYRHSRDGSPATLRMPMEPGDYEIRFVQGGQKILARQAIRITPSSAMIT
ncbi:MAG: VWD domain-containing protein, partial [Gammaproteobacteria bacterium]|nr:VWD domain-containing protein [Gammaproteobacteria bacterium]